MGFGDGINAWAEDAARAPGREAILEAAIVLLQEHGPASGGLQFRAIGVCDVLGISRTTLYKRWSSMTDVSTDFLCFNAVYADSWMHRMLRTDPAVPFHDVATAIFAPNRPETGVIIRAARRCGHPTTTSAVRPTRPIAAGSSSSRTGSPVTWPPRGATPSQRSPRCRPRCCW